MESAEHLARVLSIQTRGIQVLLWEHKTDLLRALSVLQAALPDFPDAPILLPTAPVDLQKFSIGLFERREEPLSVPRRIFLIPQASVEPAGPWLNGWRQRLADPPGTLFVVRRVDFVALYRRAPDLMSFAQSEIHEATGLLPLIARATLDRMSERLPAAWYEPLEALPGVTPTEDEIAAWIQRLQSQLG
jgi:hypothetical protein